MSADAVVLLWISCLARFRKEKMMQSVYSPLDYESLDSLGESRTHESRGRKGSHDMDG